jgi:LacI family transcriptional regulator
MTVTLKDIAQQVGVSVTTVSRALTGYDDVADETRKRIEETAESLSYHPNVTAQRLQKQKTDTLGFIMPTFGPRFADPFFSEFVAGIGNEAANHRYDLLVSTHDPDSESEKEAYRRAARGRWVDGLIVVRTREHDARIALLCRYNFPFVAFGRTDDNLDFPYVDEDGATGMRLLVEHFIELGHRRIAYISPPTNLMFSKHRLRGYRETMATRDISIHPEWIVEGDLTQRGGAHAIDALLTLEPRPTAVICGNDLMAIGAMSRIKEQGLEVGGPDPTNSIAIAGFDDISTAAYVTPSLTTVRQPIYDIGRQTCAMLIEIINGRYPETPHILLTPTLTARASSGPPLS